MALASSPPHEELPTPLRINPGRRSSDMGQLCKNDRIRPRSICSTPPSLRTVLHRSTAPACRSTLRILRRMPIRGCTPLRGNRWAAMHCASIDALGLTTAGILTPFPQALNRPSAHNNGMKVDRTKYTKSGRCPTLTTRWQGPTIYWKGPADISGAEEPTEAPIGGRCMASKGRTAATFCDIWPVFLSSTLEAGDAQAASLP